MLMGFSVTNNDSYLFTRFASSLTLFVLVYVDDIIINDNSSTAISSLVTFMHTLFALKDILGLRFVGIRYYYLSFSNQIH